MPDSLRIRCRRRCGHRHSIEALRHTLDASLSETHLCHNSDGDGVPMQVRESRSGRAAADRSQCDAEAEREEEARAFSPEGRRPFNLSEGPLIRGHLLPLAESEHIVLVTKITRDDGWRWESSSRADGVYEAFAAGRPSPLLKFQFSTRLCRITAML